MAAAKNIVIVSVDSLRYDAVSCETETRGLDRLSSTLARRRETPCFDRLARQGAHFRRVISSASHTPGAHAGLLTGQWPWVHGVRSLKMDTPVSVNAVLLSEVLKKQGFVTLSASAMPHFFHDETFGFTRGFDDKINLETHLLSRNRDDVFSWIKNNSSRRFFAFYHTAMVHDYMTESLWKHFTAHGVPDAEKFYQQLRKPIKEPLRKRMEDYLEAVRFFDKNELAPLVGFLAESGLLENTLLLVTADHGEPHPCGIREENLRVPLVLFGAGDYGRGVCIDAPVRLMDVFPTVLELLGIDPPADLPAKSLSDLWKHKDSAPREIYVEFSALDGSPSGISSSAGRELLLRGLQVGGNKLVRDYCANRWQSYDLEKDWAEDEPAEPGRSPEWVRLKARMEEIEKMDPRSAPSILTPPSPEILERLKQLGYLE